MKAVEYGGEVQAGQAPADQAMEGPEAHFGAERVETPVRPRGEDQPEPSVGFHRRPGLWYERRPGSTSASSAAPADPGPPPTVTYEEVPYTPTP